MRGKQRSCPYPPFASFLSVALTRGGVGNFDDASFGRKIRTWQSPLIAREKAGDEEDEGANLGQAFIAIDPEVRALARRLFSSFYRRQA